MDDLKDGGLSNDSIQPYKDGRHRPISEKTSSSFELLRLELQLRLYRLARLHHLPALTDQYLIHHWPAQPEAGLEQEELNRLLLPHRLNVPLRLYLQVGSLLHRLLRRGIVE